MSFAKPYIKIKAKIKTIEANPKAREKIPPNGGSRTVKLVFCFCPNQLPGQLDSLGILTEAEFEVSLLVQVGGSVVQVMWLVGGCVE